MRSCQNRVGRWCLPFTLGGLAGFVLLSAWNAWTPAAVGQTPRRPQPTIVGTFDAGKQRAQMIQALQESNKKLDQINNVLESLRDLQKETKRR